MGFPPVVDLNPRRHSYRSLWLWWGAMPKHALASAAAFAAVVLAAGCSTASGTAAATTGTTAPKAMKIALLLPETKTARYETQDKPLFEAKVKELAPTAEILYSNANQDATEQQSQADAALTNGANVLVLDPVDSASAASMVQLAKQQNVPVVSYDRLILDTPDIAAYVSFDNVKVGELQGSTLAKKLADDGNPSGPIIRINGSPTDNNATLFGQGASKELDAAGVQVAKEYDTPDWSPDKAQSEMDQAITAVGKTGFKGLYAMNDGTKISMGASMNSHLSAAEGHGRLRHSQPNTLYAAEALLILSRLGGHCAEAGQLFGGLFLPFLRGCSMIASGPGNTRLV